MSDADEKKAAGESGDTEGERGSALRTFLIADVRGYTRFTHEHGDEEAAKLAARFAELARRGITKHGGQLVELRGDEAVGVFGSAREALRAAVDLQRLFRARTDGEPALALGVGIGLDAGEAVPVEGGYRGGALNLAARLCGIAAPGEILASETVISLARRFAGMRFDQNPDTRFVFLDVHPNFDVSRIERFPNATGIFFVEGPASYLAGYLGALMEQRRMNDGGNAGLISVIGGTPEVSENRGSTTSCEQCGKLRHSSSIQVTRTSAVTRTLGIGSSRSSPTPRGRTLTSAGRVDADADAEGHYRAPSSSRSVIFRSSPPP